MNLGLSRRSVCMISSVEAIFFSALTIYLVSSWYPDNFFSLFDVGHKIIGLLFVVILLGPVIGVLFYKSDHEKYANDLSVIYIIKLCVLFLALHLAYSQRPLLIVFSVDRFVIVQAHQISLQKIPPDIVEMMMAAQEPPLVAARKLPEEDLALLLEVMNGGADIEYRPGQYERFEYQRARFYQRFCGADLGDGDQESRYDGGCESVSVPLVYKEGRYATAIFDSNNSMVKDIVLKDPW